MVKIGFICLGAILLMSSSAMAKRSPRPHLAPIEYGDKIILSEVEFSADKYSVWLICRKAHEDNKLIWRTELFRRKLNGKLERDVQMIFLKEVKLADVSKRIEATDEKGQVYKVEPASESYSNPKRRSNTPNSADDEGRGGCKVCEMTKKSLATSYIEFQVQSNRSTQLFLSFHKVCGAVLELRSNHSES